MIKTDILIIGAGPAGLEAARVCGERGHKVILIEAAATLGGQVRLASMAEVRKDLIGIIDWLETEVEHLNIEIRRQQYADVNYIMEENN